MASKFERSIYIRTAAKNAAVHFTTQRVLEISTVVADLFVPITPSEFPVNLMMFSDSTPVTFADGGMMCQV